MHRSTHSKGKYLVETGNRFEFSYDNNSAGENEDSDDDAPVKNVDPQTIMKTVEITALKAAKKNKRDAAKNAVQRAVAPTEVPVVAEEAPAKKVAENQRKNVPKDNRREPKANQGQRYGRRNQEQDKNLTNNTNTLTENRNGNNTNNGQNEQQRDNKNRDVKRERRPRNTDRKSGDPRTGVKSFEKRNGAGANNWGNKTENPNEFQQENEEQTTPEDDVVEDAENNDPQNQENEQLEDQEPEVASQTLEEYYKSQEVQESSAGKSGRKANDGEAIKGQIIKTKKIYIDPRAASNIAAGHREQSHKANLIFPNEKLNFVSGGRQGFRYDNDENGSNNFRGGRGGGRGRGGRGRGGRGGRGGGNRENSKGRGNQNNDYDNKQQNKPANLNFNSDDPTNFPRLGQK